MSPQPLAPGLTHTRTVKVTDDMTPAHLRGEPIRVLSTPDMIRLIEQTAIEALQPALAAGQSSVGTRVDVAHLAATPVGMTVTITVEVTEVDRRRVAFRVAVRDELDEAGKGTHERFIVDGAQRMPRLADKVSRWKAAGGAAMLLLGVLLGGCVTAAPRPDDLTQVGLREAAQLIRERTITSAELTQAYLARAEARRELNAFITLDRAGARAAAQRADADLAAGRVKGPLHGVPLVVKDNVHVTGLPSTAGTPALREFVPRESAPVAQKLIDAGAVILGKTNMHELAFGISGYNEAFFTARPIGTRNPYDLNRIAGGSSSGTGAAIGARLAPGGLGSDTGGSVRIPAALTGGAGLRPTLGRYSQEGITPISHSRDTAGPMAQTVADVALLDSVITGQPVPAPANLSGLKLGVYRDYFFKDLDADTKTVVDGALDKLRRAGVTVVEVDMPNMSTLNDGASFPVALYEAYDDLKAYLAKYQTGKTVEQVAQAIASKDVKGTYDGLVVPRKLPAPDRVVDAAPVYKTAMEQARPMLHQNFANAFVRYGIEALVAPTTPSVAVLQGPEASSLETFLRFIRNTDPGSNAGIPGLTIPAGIGPTTSLPVGLSLDGPRGSDARLLAIGMAIERLLGPTPPPRF
jgi:mandelamide amidase